MLVCVCVFWFWLVSVTETMQSDNILIMNTWIELMKVGTEKKSSLIMRQKNVDVWNCEANNIMWKLRFAQQVFCKVSQFLTIKKSLNIPNIKDMYISRDTHYHVGRSTFAF